MRRSAWTSSSDMLAQHIRPPFALPRAPGRVGHMGTLEASWSVEIDAPRERCYEIAADIEGAPEWQGTLERVEVLKRDREDRAVVVDTTSDASIKKVHS